MCQIRRSLPGCADDNAEPSRIFGRCRDLTAHILTFKDEDEGKAQTPNRNNIPGDENRRKYAYPQGRSVRILLPLQQKALD